MAMTLKSLSILRSDWGKDRGLLAGTMTLAGVEGEITIRVSNEVAVQIVQLCGAGIVQAAQQAANLMLAEIVENTPAQIEG